MDQIVTAAVAPTAPSPAPVTSSIVYASFGRRLGAVLLDGILLSIVDFIISGVAGNLRAGEGVAMAALINVVIAFAYYIFCIGHYGQTVGKKIAKIKVTRENGEKVGYARAALREVIGKPISGIIFLLGYLWVIWDGKKQAWHDKLAGSVVVRV